MLCDNFEYMDQSLIKKKVKWSDGVICDKKTPQQRESNHTHQEIPQLQNKYHLPFLDKINLDIIYTYLEKDYKYNYWIIIAKLCRFKTRKKLDALMFDSNHKIFKLAASKLKIKLLKYLIENVTRAKYFMLYDNDFEALRNLLDTSIKQAGTKEYNSSTYQHIFTIMLEIDYLNFKQVAFDKIICLPIDECRKSIILNDFIEALKKYDYHVYNNIIEDSTTILAKYSKGYKHYSMRQYSEAIMYFNDVISNDTYKYAVPIIIFYACHYKAMSHYAKKQYKDAINSFECIIKDSTIHLKIASLFYKGACYGYLGNFEDAEKYFREVLNLYDCSIYYKKDTIKNMAERSMIVNFIVRNDFNAMMAFHVSELGKSINDFDSIGHTLLMYAIIHKNHNCIDYLLNREGINPFITNKWNKSALSFGLDFKGNQDTLKYFFKKLNEKYPRGFKFGK